MKGRFKMRIKVPMRYMNKHFGVEKTEIRMIFSEILGSDVLNALESNFKNLQQLADASDEDILAVPGMTDKMLKNMKEVLYGYFKELIKKDELAGMHNELSPKSRLAYAELIDAAQLYSCSIKKINKAIKKLPKKERRYIKMSYGLNQKWHKKTLKEISEKLDIPVCELDDYKVRVLGHLCNIAH